MITALSFFVISVIALLVMVYFRVWELRVGRIAVRDEEMPETLFSIDRMEKGAETFFKKMQFFSFHAVILSFTHLADFLRHVDRAWREEWQKFKTRLPKHLPPESHGGSSVFLKDITAHRDEVRRENGYHGE